ncbi:MAG: hypothetical protein KC416_16780, partial [Myxococcales bacterium]|nr:hypothetical protein [Myxococcales bacterium]
MRTFLLALFLSAAVVPMATAQDTTEPTELSGMEKFDKAFAEAVVGPIAAVLFWDVVFWDNDSESNAEIPIVLAWLVLGAIFFTLRFQFINIR